MVSVPPPPKSVTGEMPGPPVHPETINWLAPAPPGYHDTVVPRVGFERAFTPSRSVSIFWRSGFFFEPSPAPAQHKASNLYDNHRAAPR